MKTDNGGRWIASYRGPHPIDVKVGARLRERRLMLRMSQQELADSVGITFQQVQKYENGANRISASRLFEFAQKLEVPVEWFFAGLGERSEPAPQKLSRRDAEVVRMMRRLQGTPVGDALLDLAQGYARQLSGERAG